jgi:hypothetical protein
VTSSPPAQASITASPATTTPAVGHTYLDVGAVRIQTYLARSRHLWGRRGASAVLAEICRPDSVDDLARELSADLPVTVRRNDEAAEVDGVVSVIIEPAAGTTTAAPDPDGLPRRVAERIAAWMSRELPGLQLEAHAAGGADYITARRALARMPVLEWLPAQLEYPPNELCSECGQDAAVADIVVVDRRQRVCADCYARRTWTQRGGQGPTRHPAVVYRRMADVGTDVGTFTVEARLLAALGIDSAVDDFGDLASLSRRRRGNHLATIAADGNALGAFFAAVKDRVAAPAVGAEPPRQGRELLGSLSRDVATTTWEALLAATAEVFDRGGGDEFVPVTPHISGGDDLLVSVTADRTWRFVLTLLQAFGGLTAPSPLTTAAVRLGLDPPTLSAGVVISHASLPFGQQVTLSAELLEQAKTAVSGHGFSVAWLDTTRDGSRPVEGRQPLMLTELMTWKPGLDRLAGLPQSTLHGLRREIDTGDARYAQQRLRSRLRRQEPAAADAVRAFLDCAGDNLLSADWHAAECVRVLQAGLSLAMWW